MVITDICMEPVDGLTLIENLQTMNKDLVFIVISGYSDFHYAQTAMKYGVSTYILKPIENEDLTAALVALKNKLDQKHQTKKIVAEYTDKKNESFLAELLVCSENIQTVYEQLCKENFHFPENKSYAVVNMQIENLSKEEHPKQYIPKLQKIAKDRVTSEKCPPGSAVS